MANKQITLEEARIRIDALSQELGLIVSSNKGFLKITSPETGHKVYIQNTKHLGRVDSSLDFPIEEPGREAFRLPLKAANGSIKCHVLPTLENVEALLRAIADLANGTHTINRPRPFAATKQSVHRPRPVAEPVPEIALEPVPEGGSLADRLERLRTRGRLARINRRMENDTTGLMTRELAEAIEDGRVSPDDLAHVPDIAAREAQEAMESGVEVEQ